MAKEKKNAKVKTNKKSYVGEVRTELKKVKWPDKKYMIKYSIATFGTIILTCAYFSLVTAVFAIIKKGILG